MLGSDFEEYRTFVPNERARRSLDAMLSEVVSWSTALAGLRRAQKS